MTDDPYVSVAVEGESDTGMARALLESAGLALSRRSRSCATTSSTPKRVGWHIDRETIAVLPWKDVVCKAKGKYTASPPWRVTDGPHHGTCFTHDGLPIPLLTIGHGPSSGPSSSTPLLQSDGNVPPGCRPQTVRSSQP